MNAPLSAAIAATMSMSAAQFAEAANTGDVFNTTATNLSLGTNYTTTINPTTATTTDVQFSGSYTTPAGLTINGPALNFGTLNDTDTTQSLVISNSATNTANSITLNTASNSTPNANASDLLYVASNANLSIQDGAGTSTTTLNFAATGSIDDAGTLAISALTVADGNTISSAGGGTLTLGPDTFNLGPNTGNATLDLSGLSSFTYNSSSSTFSVDTETAGTVTTSGISATMKLAGNNSITAMAINVGIGKGGDPQASEVGVLQLGQANVLDTGNLTIGLNRDGGTLNFSSGLSSPTVTIAGTTGGTSRATIIIGQNNSGAGGTGPSTAATRTSTLDFSNSSGTGFGVETVLAGAVTVGYDTRGSAGTPAIAASLVLGAGSFDATTITLGQDVSGDTTSDFPNGSAVTNVGIVSGTLTTGSGTLNVGALTLGQHVGGDTITGTVNLNNGGTIYATTIQAGTNTGSGTAATRSFNWNNGTIGNYRNLSAADTSETNLAITSAVTWTLASTGTHTFNIDAGYTGSVGAVLAGTNGTLVKAGGGTLALTVANSYTGATTVNSGTLEVDGSLASGSAVTVGGLSASGTPFLTGAGTVSGTVSLASAGGGAAGNVSPGTVGGIGKLTTGAETWNSGATYQWDIGSSAGTLSSGVNGTPGTTYDDLVATAGLTVPTAGTVTIAPTGSLTGITGGTTYTWVLAQINTLSVGGAGVTASGTPITSDFALNTSGLNASINGGTSTTAAGTFSLFFEAETVPSSTNDLVLSYTAAPEPGAAMLFAAGAGSLFMRRRRRQRACDISVLL